MFLNEKIIYNEVVNCYIQYRIVYRLYDFTT